MNEGSAALQLAGWVGRKGRGTARLAWEGGELALRVSGLQIVGVEGDGGELLAEAFDEVGEGDWFEQARTAVAAGQATEEEAVAAVKRALSERLREFLLADGATVSFEPGIPPEDADVTVSYPHLIVELVLGVEGDALVPRLVRDPSMVLRRLPDFAHRVGALQMTDEALAILAKINDMRSVEEIAGPSPHGRDTVARLLAATVGAGLVEITPSLSETPLAAVHPRPEEPPVSRPRRWWLWLLALLALAVVAVVALGFRPWERAAVGAGGPWSVAVDGGCQPAELERLYRRVESDSEQLAVVPIGSGDNRCYRLVWGHFANQAAAEQAMAGLPGGLVARGFTPHVVRVEPDHE